VANIFKRPCAKTDLAEIWDYIADDSEDRADAFIETISRKLTILAENPDIGRVRGELAEKSGTDLFYLEKKSIVDLRPTG